MTTLDREWERIQERTFTKWTNSHLKKRGMEVENLTTSLQDGTKLINLYEIISDEPLAKYYKQPKMKIHSIANLSTVVDKINSFVSSVGIKVQFSAEQIYEGEKRQILGMIWCLIHKFEIQDISEDELSAKEGLLLWVQKKTKGYKDVDVQNFHYSFQDGLAFCALIHRHRPDLIDFDSLSAANKKENLELAFKVAEEKLDIPQLLDSQDMIDYKPDEKSVMTYVAYYWKKFASSQKNEKAANVIGKNVSRQRMLEQLQSDYERRATALLAWVAESKVNLSDTSSDHFGYSLEAVSEKNVAFKDFKNNQKPTQLAEKLDLEVLLANLRSQQKSAGLPIYTPPEELSTESINASWAELNDVQDTYEKVLKERIALMKRLEILVNRFRSRAERIKTWQSEKLAAFGAEDITKYDTVSALQARAKTQESFADEFASINNSLNDSKQIAQEVIDNQHATSGELQQTIADLEQAQQQVQETSESLLQRLQQALAELEAIINKCFEYARIAEQLSLFLEEGGLALGEAVRANTVADVEAYEAIVSKVQTDLENAQAQLDQLVTLNSEVQAAGHDVSNYSNKGVDSLQEKFSAIKDQLAGRQTEASTERERQEGNAGLLKQFADQAAEYNNWTEEQKNAVNADIEGSLADQLNALQAKQGTLAQESDEKLAALVQLYQQIEEADIAEQSNTGLQSLQVLNEQLKQVAAKRVEAINQAILAEKASNLSEEQLAEIANTFKHFDKDGNGTLSKVEFKAASASLGEDYTDEELERVFSSLDTNGNGGVSFSEFVTFFEKVKREGTGYEDVLAAFETLTGGQPVITEAQLRGSGMPAEEVDYLLSAMPAVEGGFDFKAYLATQYGK